MSDYPFDLVQQEYPGGKKTRPDDSWIQSRPILQFSDTLKKGAEHFISNERMLAAINTAIAVGEPLLVTGEPGTGKTQIAYFVAWKLGLGKVLHFQTKSSSKAQHLLYHFDTVRYFHEAHLAAGDKTLDRQDYIDKGPLWQALESGKPRVLLIDEIDKAPRDFPNDLLLELDQNRFFVPEIDPAFEVTASGNGANRPIIIITSNSERRLPEPFLRRCIYHYVEFDETLLKNAVTSRQSDYPGMSDAFIGLAIRCFVDLRKLNLRKKPSTGELLTWMRVLSASGKIDPGLLQKALDSSKLSELPHLEALLKDASDLDEVRSA